MNLRGEPARAVAAVRSAVEAWTAPEHTSLAPKLACEGAPGISVSWDAPWPALFGSSSLVVGHTELSADNASGDLARADVHLNAQGFSWAADGQGGAIDVEAAALHEIGHALGLAHACDETGAPGCQSDATLATAVMNPAPPLVERIALGSDDAAGITAIYPSAEVADFPALPTASGCPPKVGDAGANTKVIVGNTCSPITDPAAIAVGDYDLTAIAVSGKRRTNAGAFQVATCAAPPTVKRGCGGFLSTLAILPLFGLALRRRRAAILFAALLIAPSAHAFVRSSTEDGGGLCLFWAPRQLTFVINENCAPMPSRNDCLDAVAASFAAWSLPQCTDLNFINQGTTARADVGYDPEAPDNINLVVWRTQTCKSVAPADDECHATSCGNKFHCWDADLHGGTTIAVTTATFNKDTGQIVDADIELNEAPSPGIQGGQYHSTTIDSPKCSSGGGAPPDCVSTDIRNTLTHECGHFLGMGHSLDAKATMFKSANIGDTNKRVLSDDDAAGICAIYPRDKAVNTCLGNAVVMTAVAESDGGGCGCGSANDAGLWALIVCSAFVIRRRRSRF